MDPTRRALRRTRIGLIAVSMLCALLVVAVAGVIVYWKLYLLEPESDPFTRGPYVTRLDGTSAALRWRVEGGVPVTVRAVGPDGSQAEAGAEGVLTGLTPGTRYAWTASVDGISRASGSFRTAPDDPRAPVTFGVIGDYGSGNDHEYAVGRVLNAQRPDFTLTAGDNAYLFAAPWVLDRTIFQPLRGLLRNGPLWATMGDHDLFWRDGAAVDEALDLPGEKGIYSVDYGGVFVVSMGDQPDQATADWAERELAASDAPAKFAVMHRPLQPGNAILRMLKLEGVAAVFAGHLHRYERRIVDGVLQFTVGTSGQGPGDLEFTKASKDAIVSLLDYGALRVDVTGEDVRYTFIDEGGRVLDRARS